MNPQTPCPSHRALHHWLRAFAGINVPTRAVCPGHQAPFEYIRRAYFEPAADLVVWAPRGGGKTRLGAAATLLDLLHKPRCAVRILGGSLDQSLRMWEHLLPDITALAPDLLGRAVTHRRPLRLRNGASVAVLTQSQRAVRGLRIQKLRCDEVELFDPAVWDAAQRVTRSIDGPSSAGAPASHLPPVAGSVEAISTLHVPFGLMQRIIEQASQTPVPVIRWCLMEVLERCPAERDCGTCPLWDECRGRAKTHCDGFFRIDDAIAIKRRSSLAAWEAEMLCRRPSVRDAVFPDFDERIHIRKLDPAAASISALPTSAGGLQTGTPEICLAIDFGFRAPFVCLWIEENGGQTLVFDEHVEPARIVAEHVKTIEARSWPRARRIACDPAGAGPNEQTARSNVELLRAAGYAVRYRSSLIVDGLEAIRTALRPAAGEPTLFIHPRCRRLIAAMQAYRYKSNTGESPHKDGIHDHLIDALRYHFVNRPRPGRPWGAY